MRSATTPTCTKRCNWRSTRRFDRRRTHAMTAAALPSTNASLSQWLRLLWDRTPPLRFDSVSPCIAAGEIHLPARDRWQHHAAAAAHATAHLVYSPTSFDGAGL